MLAPMPLSPFHPAIRRWFEETLGAPTEPQSRGWPEIRAGRDVLIAAPTGSGKTLAAFLAAIDSLVRRGGGLEDETRVLYVSPLKALGNDVRKNLEVPLRAIREADASVPPVRVLVRSGDTPARERAAMSRRPPHVLVTTPESLYILLTSESGRSILRTVRTAIVDEIHAVLGDKRGSHLALSLERLEALAGNVQRIGLSATQRPIETVAAFLAGSRPLPSIVDAGHLRDVRFDVEVPHAPLSAVASAEQWHAIDARVAALVREHRTTLVFVNTRRLAERVAARLGALLPAGSVLCHHGSLSRERRLDAEEKLKTGRLRALVSTASLELGIDVGDVDLAVQLGSVRSISTLLQRAGRSGHSLRARPRGVLFPLTRDEAVEAAAAVRAARRGVLDRTIVPRAPLDILAQQVVAACVPETWDEDALFELVRRARPYRELAREDFDAVVDLHARGRSALLHRDGIGRRLRATRRARIVAVTSGGAIPDTADYRVLLEPGGTLVGTVNEDFAVESSRGDVFQLGTAAWRVERVEPGIVRVTEAPGQIPTVPFWFGEAPSRTAELSEEVSAIREEGGPGVGFSDAADLAIREFLATGRKQLGTVPTLRRAVLERFFDESGGQQLVLHAPFGSRVNRALGLALRKRFCRGFGFELQAAANDEAVILSLGTSHSFPLEEVFGYLAPASARRLLEQAILASPLFETRWRWNLARSLVLERTRGGKRVPATIQRMRAADKLAEAFPAAAACFETLPPGDVAIPMEHPIVRQTVEDCLNEAMDVEGLERVVRGMRSGEIETVAVDATEPSVFAAGILAAPVYAFLDDAPLEERRVQAVNLRRTLGPKTADEIGALDPDAIRRVKEEAWPAPDGAEELHEALLWMGYATDAEAAPWRPWLAELLSSGRVVREGDRWFAAEAPRDPKSVMKGRLEATGPHFGDEPELLELEREGVAMRARFEGREGFCDRRLLARIHRSTIDRLRREIEPVEASVFARFLSCWQHLDPDHRLPGPNGVVLALGKLAGVEAPAAAWDAEILPARVEGYRPEWLDRATLSGEIAFGRLYGSGLSAPKATPVAFFPREDMDSWLGLAPPPEFKAAPLRGAAADVLEAMRARGPMFPADLARVASIPPSFALRGLAELVALGLATADSFGSFRALFKKAARGRGPAAGAGRFGPFRAERLPPPPPEFVARALLRRTGVVFRKTVARERLPMGFGLVARALRTLEARGEIRGGRFVAGTDGEQYALPEAVALLREARRKPGMGATPMPPGDPAARVAGDVAASGPAGARGAG